MKREVISSRHNDWFKRFRHAAVRHDEEIMVEGRKFVTDSIRAGFEPIAIAVDETAEFDAPLSVIRFSPPLFHSLSDTKTTQGIIGLFRRPRAALDSLPASGVVCALDSVQDPGNVGTIVRLAAAFDAAGVVALDGSADPFSPKAIRASAGAIFAVTVVQAKRHDFLKWVDQRNLKLYALDTEGTVTVDGVAKRSAVVFGSEGAGVSDVIAARATTVRIPMSEKVESLNVGAAAAIVLSSMYRR